MFRPVANRLSLNARASIYQIWRRSLVPSFVALRPITARQEYLLHTSSTPPLQHQPVTVPTFSSEDTVHIVNDKPEPSEPQSNPNGSYNYVVAASWHPKNRNTRKSKDNAEKIPYWKRNKVGKVDAGEDAFFHTNTRKGLAVGVADGVGGWAEVGVDPALFSWTLMNNCANIAKDLESINAHDILDNAFTELVDGRTVSAGSSTACILEMCKKTGYMTSCNLGDSAFILIRDEKIVFESPSQQHFFNCPYQLTVVPDNYPNRASYVTDLPKDGDRKSFFLRNGDLIVLATDGYFDNVYSQETVQLVNAHMAQLPAGANNADVLTHVRVLAKMLTDAARRLSLDPKRLSPWAKGARAHGGHYRGGKVDDITCIVTLVQQENNAQE
ncbi:hypothetical protein INT43_006094 [Umbelopsis isabellina]|uniref:Protein phosphatase n=1 Tax=Mortierella isabellina TaxID=91625 RepID=A0A8H7PJA6_MORIS|nr:hypothetical protein INT43_006094 [Umbelopsis isabellina]